jgi:HlyD family secretion protein
LVDAWNEHAFVSKVLSVHNLPTTGQTVVTYQAVLSVDNTTLLLRPGMTATATITTDERKGVLLVPNAALRFSPPEKASNSGSSIPFLSGGVPGGAPKVGGGSGRQKTAANKKIITAADSQGLVYVLEENRPKRTVVEVAGTDGEQTEIKSGLSAGTAVITSIDMRKTE